MAKSRPFRPFAEMDRTDEITVGLIATRDSSAAVIYGLYEVFASVGTAWRDYTGQDAPTRAMRPVIVAESAEPFAGGMGRPIAPDRSFDDTDRYDVVVAVGRGIGRAPTEGIELGLELAEAFDDAEKTAIREELAAMLSASDAQAGDWLARGIWLSEKVVDPVNTVRRMTDFLIARVGEDEIRQLDAALARITRTGRPASHEQKLFLHRFRERAGLSG